MTRQEDFLRNPKVLSNYSLLEEIGVFTYIDTLKAEIKDYEDVLRGAREIFTQPSIDTVLETTVKLISDKFLPSFMIFLWKPSTTHQDLIVKGYKNFRPFDVRIALPNLSVFETFFKQYPRPISFELFEFQLQNEVATAPLRAYEPAIVIPIIGPSGLYGLILVGNKLLEDQYSPQELLYLDRLMAFCSQAIQNLLNYEHSVRDLKTGLYNHGYFRLRLQDEIARSHRLHIPFSLIIMDVDRFKSFNDTYGHLAGDRVLEAIALTIRESLRVQDIPARFGGEEFTVLLPETDRAGAWLVAERLRQKVAKTQIPWDPPLPSVTISVGAVEYEPASNLTPEEIIARADKALYQSKQRGRNRTTMWGAGLLQRTILLARQRNVAGASPQSASS
ncbi:MAG: sensor domain-containing diguanylate cyclase [Treponemataceae bacterium]|uniref:GGDEF domain-containing protein n=1 Tax=Treponema sp. J25 TaxID=2094121 RepID=UPI001049D924|nr:sensor domain-containing diguanylate cyclase [Treponema sp. J25]MCX7948751.1 sensor domain-containing diguanylate cyclase [Treponemataceae bacterium]HOK00184.1 sensor domain-containing diguanylate cyclase [Termitinemataceae bacterium]TCW61148.1 GGDEF domain-containing protein [Treponema sp. J25]HOM23361.1 sensor domain-containing diguanylate cyclase [Termitinemataceae bacterium]HPQ00133.1 sensor domain-containing diguanylate cyclase [Termitinemataceae bacterium]